VIRCPATERRQRHGIDDPTGPDIGFVAYVGEAVA
jgi:hypothetical protein